MLKMSLLTFIHNQGLMVFQKFEIPPVTSLRKVDISTFDISTELI